MLTKIINDSKKYLVLLFFIGIISSGNSFPQMLLKADGPGNTYELVRSKGLKLEVPDCVHQVKHVSEIWDDELKEYVFAFDSHVSLDNDRCRNFDRERTELTVTDSLPPSYLGAHDGDTFTYTWKFKLDSGYKANPSFCHIHQIKAVGGDDGAPIITLTTRAGTPDMLQLIFSAARGKSGSGILKEVNLAQFKGVWITATEHVTYNVNGEYSIILKRISDGDTLLYYTNNDIGLSRTGAKFYRPKIGIYRSLKNKAVIRNETIRFADFGIANGTVPCTDPEVNNSAPAAPTRIKASALSRSSIVIEWYDNSYNEDHFRIERSTNKTDWTLAALVTPTWERWSPQTLMLDYADTALTSGTIYYYRIRAENLFGNSDYSETAETSTYNAADHLAGKKLPGKFALRCFPNPFNPSTQVEYQIPVSCACPPGYI